MDNFENPRPSIELEKAAHRLSQIMRAEGFSAATLSAFECGHNRVQLHTDRPVAGHSLIVKSDYEPDRTISTVTLAGQIDEINEVGLLGPAYVATDAA